MASEQPFTKTSGTLADLEIAWQDRLAGAQAMLAAGRPAAAIANAVYALEIRLKVRICKLLEIMDLPKPFAIHDLNSLLLLAGLSRRLQAKKAAKVRSNWVKIKPLADQLNALRYLPDSNWSLQQAADLLSQLNDSPNGVLIWIAKQ